MIQRKKQIKRGAPPKRSQTPIPPRKKGKPRRKANVCQPYLDWLKTQRCRITGYHTGRYEVDWSTMTGTHILVDPAHVRVKNLGGDLYNAISLSRHLHEEWHQHGAKTFAAKYGVDLKALAIGQTEEWLAGAEGQAWLDVQYQESR